MRITTLDLPPSEHRATVPRPISEHIRETWRLAMPIIAARTAMLTMFIVDTIMAGWAGAEDIAAMGLGIAPLLVLMLVSLGALQSVVVLTAQSFGAGDVRRCGAIFRIGVIHALFLGCIVAVLSIWSRQFFLVVGQTPELSELGARVMQAFAWGIPGLLAFTATNLYMEATGRPQAGLYVLLVINMLNVPLNGIFGLGWGGVVAPGGADGMVAVSSALRWLAFLALLGMLLADERRRGNPTGLMAPWRVWIAEAVTLGGELGRRLRGTGVPMGLAQGIESAAFACIVFVAGTLGTIALAAHQITMSVVTLVYMTAVGMAGATAIRVGHAVGAGSRPDILRAGTVGIALGALISLPVGIAIALAPDRIAGIYTDEPAVIAITRHTFLVAGILLAFDAAMGVVTGALRGAGDVWVPTLAQTAAFWMVGLPVAIWLATSGGLGPVGLMAGIVIGTLASLGILLPRFGLVVNRPIKPI